MISTPRLRRKLQKKKLTSKERFFSEKGDIFGDEARGIQENNIRANVRWGGLFYLTQCDFGI
jgi:hypothetical protein